MSYNPNTTNITNGTATDAGTLSGSEIVSISRGNGLLSTSWNTVSTFITNISTIFTQAGTGAVARTLQAKLRDNINANDYDTLSHAMVAAASAGVTLILPSGTISVPANTTLPAGLTMGGVRGATILQIIGSGNINAGGNNIQIRNMSISGGINGFNTNGFSNILVENIDFSNQSSHQIYCNSSNNKFRYNTFVNGSASGIALDTSNAFGNEISNNTLTNCANFGIWVSNGANKNLIAMNLTYQNGLELVGVTYDSWGNRIHFNHAEGTGDNGISVTGYRNSVVGNICNANANHGIGLYGERNTCVGNAGKNNGQRNVASPGAGNYAGVTATPAFGGLGRKNIIAGNIFDDDQSIPTQYTPVKLEVNSHIQWSTGLSILNSNLYCFNGVNIYRATTAGTTGSTPPTHTSGTVSDGGVSWTFIASNVNSLSKTYAAWTTSQTITTANLYRYNANIVYLATSAGTTGSTPPTHTSGTVSDGGVSWTFIEEFPSGSAALDSYDCEVSGNGGSGNITASDVVNNSTNKHQIVMRGLVRLPAAGRNQYSDMLNGNGSPAGVVTARPGSIYARQDVSAPGIAFWVKQSGTDSSGWLRVTLQDSGTTAARPSLTSYGTGARNYSYFDTTLNKPIWWSGSAWVDATGTSV